MLLTVFKPGACSLSPVCLSSESVVGSCSLPCGVFSSIPGLHQVEPVALPSFDNQKCFQTLSRVPWRAKPPSIPVVKYWVVIT